MRTVSWILAFWVLGLGGYLLYEAYWPGATGTVVVVSDLKQGEIWLDLQPTGMPGSGAVLKVGRGKHSVMIKHPSQAVEPFVQVVEVRPGRADTLRFTVVETETIAMQDSAITETVEAEDEGQVRVVPPKEQSIKERVREEMPWDVPRPAPQSVDTITAKIAEETTPETTPETKPETTPRVQDKIMGSVEISSSRAGATIYVNDKLQEEKTPTTLTLEAGTYTIRAELEGYTCTPQEQAVRVSRAASSQFIFFTLIEEQKTRREITIRTEPVEGEIFIDSVLVGTGEAIIPHEFGVFNIMFGDVADYVSPEPVRLTVTPTNANPVVTGTYLKMLEFAAYCTAENTVMTEGNIGYEVGVYFKGDAPKVSATHGPRVKEIPGSQKFGWELGMGDPNRNPPGSDYIEFIFTMPEGEVSALPLSLKLYLYRSNKKYPLSISGRSEVTVMVNGRIFLDNYRPHNGPEAVEFDRFEEWSLQHTLIPGENRVMIRSGNNNNIHNYLWKIAIE
ncbi:PEGA domain-containing protein [bacterium]|nr:PEGA domain-containing protein [bacterium]